MLFHTWTFAFFFLIVWIGYVLMRRGPLALPWLLAASYLFYGAWRPAYLLLIVYSTLVDYVAVEGMARTGRRGLWLSLSLINNLGLLGLLKYGDFVIGNLDSLCVALGLPRPPSPPGWELPVGISFYTFQSLSYTIDFWRGRIPRESNLIRFATYVAFFPQLVAGPIERCSSLLPQLVERRPIRVDDLACGASWFLVGLFKKLALADQLGAVVDRVYADPSRCDGPTVIAATFAFAWQIYFDFSGYSDMARGAARAIGFDLMVNFRHPYLATGLADFWARWHISLSQWFRDYLYVPLGGNRVGAVRWSVNILVTFLASGLWHGPAWTFVLWGAWHGIGLVALRPLERRGIWNRVPVALRFGLVQTFVLIGWSMFRAGSTADLIELVRACGRWEGIPDVLPLGSLLMILAVWLHQGLSESRWSRLVRHPLVAGSLAVGMIVYLAVVPLAGSSAFIYFQF
ncbi:MAG TPA: hypothetical protein DCQ98_02780 [Planctomycetaceae bacterium]|nr:hypothetical protein [Planctomycetaceae bacterium]HRF00120.1 MBOAT family O-acyltransferase [Pirellulaceae bacterium]